MTPTRRWAACGAMALTGDPAGPPLAPATSAAAMVDAALAPFGLDAGVLAERAASAGLARGGRVACGRGSRVLRAADGWLALTLSRPDDVASLPALLEAGFDGEPAGTGDGAPWERVARLVATRPAAEVAARADMLGMPCGVVGEPVAAPPFPGGAVAGEARRPPPYVVDLSALWAGPLATSCLLRVGATVVKVEDVRRPDGARRGDPAFHDLLNGGKLSVALDLGTAAGRRALTALVDRADIVVTSARARAVEALGLDPEAALAAATDKVWVAITAHGWDSSRVGFGDDVAAAAGLVAWHPEDGEPRFAADAIADPLAGALAAHAALAAWQHGGRHFLDASLAAAARSVAPPAADPARAAEPGRSIDSQLADPHQAAARPVAPPATDPARAAEPGRSIDSQLADPHQAAARPVAPPATDPAQAAEPGRSIDSQLADAHQTAARPVAPPATDPARAAEPGRSIDSRLVDAHQAAARAAEPPRVAEMAWSIDGEPVAPPRRRAADRPAAVLGADTEAVLAAVSA